MALITIPPGLNLVAWTGPATTLSSAPWFTATNLNGVYKPAVNRLGFISNKPGAAFPSFTQITPAPSGGIPLCYIFNVKTAFQLDDSLLGLVAPATPNTIPTASASNPATITLPTNQVALQGTGTDSDGTVVAYAWRQVTGPNTATGLPATTQNVLASNLIAGTYLFGFKTQDDDGAFSNEVFVNATVNAAASTVLAAPTLSAPTAVSFDSFTQGWSQITNNSGYDVQYSTSSSFPDTAATTTLQVSTNAISRVIGGLAATTEYYVRVRARGTGSFANSPYSASVSATTLAVPAGTVTLSAPTGAAVPEGLQALRVTGSTITSATGYRLFRSLTSGGTFTQLGGTLPTPTYLDGSLLNDTSYFYKWQAVGNGSSFADSIQGSEFAGRTQAQPQTPSPTNSRIDDDLNTFDFTFSDSTALSDYEYYILDSTQPITLTQKPIEVGNLEVPAGQMGVRRKAAGTLAASNWLTNQGPFRTAFVPPLAFALDHWLSTERRVDLQYESLTALTQAVSAGATGITVLDASDIPLYSQLRIGTEVVCVTNTAGNALTISPSLSGNYSAGQAVERALILQMRNLSDGAQATVAASVSSIENAPIFLRNPETGATWAAMDGVNDRLNTVAVFGPDFTEFIVAQVQGTAGGYVLAGSGSDSFPALYANLEPGQLNYFPSGAPTSIIHTGGQNLFVACIRNTAGGTRTIHYADTQNPTPTKVVEVAASANPLHSGQGRNGIGNINSQGLNSACKMLFKEYAIYGQAGLSDAQVATWMNELAIKYLQPSAQGGYPSSYPATY